VWYEADASGAVLGRLATEVARVLRGKHKTTFAPHLDMGDHVIVVNAAQVVLSSGKADKKFHYRHSGYPGGLRTRSYSDMLAKRPEEVIRITVKGMLPKGPLGRQMLRKLKVYAGPEHPHSAQTPKPLVLDHSAHRVS
jgi:large subunit ribosomal protein L13